MAKVKHLSDGTNTWDVGGGTEVFTANTDHLWNMNINVARTSVSGSTVSVTTSEASVVGPDGTTYPGLAPATSFGIQQGDTIHFVFNGTLPADAVDTIAIEMFYTLNLSQAGSMVGEYYGTVTTAGYPGSTLNQSAAPAPIVYDRLKVVAPLKVTNDGDDDCLGADISLPNKVELGKSDSDSGYDQLIILDANNAQIGNTSYFNRLTPVIYGKWSDYDSTNECFTGISIDDEDELVQDCILVVYPYSDGCCYAKITFDTQVFGSKYVHFCNEAAGVNNTWYFTTTRKIYFRVTLTNSGSDIMLTPIENPSMKYEFIDQATDIDHVSYVPVKDSTATVNQIIGAMLAVYGWGSISQDNSNRTYVLQTSNESNINPDTTITLIKNREYVECQHFTSPVNDIFKLINAGGGKPIIPIQAVSCSPNASNANLCLKTSAVFYDNQTAAANRGWKLPKEASWPSNENVSDYCYNFFIFGTLQSGV